MAQKMKQTAPKSRGKDLHRTSAAITDPRFTNFQTDPRFRIPSRSHTKVKVDSRFAKVLEDDDFVRKARVDKYGRRVGSSRGKREMKRLYEVVGDEDQSGGEEPSGLEGDAESGEEDDVVRRELRRVGAGMSDEEESELEEESSSESSDESETESEDEEVEEMGLRVTEKEVPMGDVSSRLAAVNLDWDNIRAVDLMAVASSFVPQDVSILKVTVYPSEFGRERMEYEDTEGPPREIFAKSKRAAAVPPIDVADNEEDMSSEAEGAEEVEEIKERLLQNSKSEDFDSSALRRYQLDRLRYYYAVIECSSSAVGKMLYDAMDGREYLSSANFFDLRFVPDDVTFGEDRPRDECQKVPDGYRPAEFVTDALQHSKVRLTWDEDDRERKDIQKRAFGANRGKNAKSKGLDGPGEDDLAVYVASGTSDEDEDIDDEQEEEDAAIAASRFGIVVARRTADKPEKQSKKDKAAALRAALGLQGEMPSKSSRSRQDEKPVGNLQITFSAGLSAGPSRESVFVNEPQETTVEKYVRKEKERKARRKEKAKASKAGESDVTKEEGTARGDEEAPTSPKPEEPSVQSEDPFADPFFEDPVTADREAAKKAKHSEKERLRREREVEEKANAKQRAELELLMADEEARDGTGNAVRHFDMNDIAKAEKDKKRRKRRGKDDGNGIEAAVKENGDGFQIQVNDPRFAKLYESHEFAIDPNDSHFKATDGMKALLEESRRRGKRKAEVREERGTSLDERNKSKKRRMKNSSDATGEDVMKLVQKVKARVPIG